MILATPMLCIYISYSGGALAPLGFCQNHNITNLFNAMKLEPGGLQGLLLPNAPTAKFGNTPSYISGYSSRNHPLLPSNTSQ